MCVRNTDTTCFRHLDSRLPNVHVSLVSFHLYDKSVNFLGRSAALPASFFLFEFATDRATVCALDAVELGWSCLVLSSELRWMRRRYRPTVPHRDLHHVLSTSRMRVRS